MEEWKEVEGYTSYDVSNKGVVRERSNGRIMPQTINGGFWCTNLISDYGKSSLCKVHRLVAIAFIPNRENLYSVEHREDRLLNHVDNLRWKPKMVKEVKVKEPEPTIDHLGTTYTLKEFASLCGIAVNLLRSRLSYGWTTVECKVGRRNFTGEGVSYDGYWFPTERECKAYQWKKELERREQSKIDKARAVQERIESRLAYRKAGVGNFVNYPIPGIVNRLQLKVYRVWSGIISRCYSPKNQNYDRYGGRGVYVCSEWLEFQGFAAWYNGQYKGEDWHIDKDILVESNLVYSPETCTFVPPSINTFFATLPKNEGFLPTLNFDKGGYKASVSDGNYKYNKTFKSQHEGFIFYKKFKEDRAKELAKEFQSLVDQRITQALLDFTVTLPPES